MKSEDLSIIDDFLSKKDFEELCQLKIDKIEDNIKVYHNRINKDNVVEISCVDKKLIEELHKNYHEKATNILKKLKPEKLYLYDYSDFSIIVTHKNYQFPFHDDTPNKILSGVVYLYPKKNNGTIFSNDKNQLDEFLSKIQAGVVYTNRSASATTAALVSSQPFVGWKNSGSTGKGAGGENYLQQFIRTQTQTRCD